MDYLRLYINTVNNPAVDFMRRYTQISNRDVENFCVWAQ